MLRWIVFFCALPVGASIINIVNCNGSVSTVTYGLARCAAFGDETTSTASGSITATGNTVTVNSSDSSYLDRPIGIATAETQISEDFTTGGPTRTGWLFANQSFVESVVGGEGQSFGKGVSINGTAITDYFMPITLGTTLDFFYDIGVNATFDPLLEGPGGIVINAGPYILEFFEADRTTPVNVSLIDPASVPEPGSFALIGLVLLMGAVRVCSLRSPPRKRMMVS